MNTVIVGNENVINYTVAKALVIHFFKSGQWTVLVDYHDGRFFLERSLDQQVKDPSISEVKFDQAENVIFYTHPKDYLKLKETLNRLRINLDREIAIRLGSP